MTKSIDERYEEGIPHDPKSIIFAKELAKIDQENSNYFDFKFGGDGDSGEELMYLLDIFFEQQREELQRYKEIPCPECKVNSLEYKDDDMCAWCFEIRSNQ